MAHLPGDDHRTQRVTLTAGQDNVVTITVTAPNGSDTETYTLTI